MNSLQTPKHEGTGVGFAKVILMGEHAVVYGEPALAVPLTSMQIEAVFEPTQGGLHQMEALGIHVDIDSIPEYLASLRTAVDVSLRATAEYLGKTYTGYRDMPGFTLHLDSDIPPGRGMGSSAAAASATVKSIFAAYDIPLDAKLAYDLTQQAETVAHGKSSGVDALTTSVPMPVIFQRGEGTIVQQPMPGYIVIADTGVSGNTAEAVGGLRAAYDANPGPIGDKITELGRLSAEVIELLPAGQIAEAGLRFTKAGEILAELGLSIPALDNLVQVALAHGALGAKLTGAGHGGCIVALAGDKDQADKIVAALDNNGAKQTWIHKLAQ